MAVTTIVSSAYDTSGAGGRKMVKLSNGWLVSAVNSTYLNFYVSKDNGQTWSLLGNTSTGSITGWSICSSGTTVYAVAVDASYTRTYAFDATTASSPIAMKSLADSGQTAMGSGCSLTIDNAGTLHAVWLSRNSTYPNSYNFRYSKSTDGGSTWATPTQITTWNTSGTDGGNPCIIVRSNNLPVLLGDSNGTGTQHVDAWWFDGTNWNHTNSGNWIYGNSSGTSEYAPVGVVDSTGTIHVVWYGTDSTNSTYYNIRYAKSTDGGNTWSAMVNLTNQNSYHQYCPTITLDAKDRLYVYWYGVDSALNTTYNNIRRIVGEPQGTLWGVIKTLTNNTTNHDYYPQTPWQITYTLDRFARYMWQDNQTPSIKYNMDNNVQIAAWSAYDPSGNGGRKLVQLSNGWLVAGAIPSGHSEILYVSKDNGQTWTNLYTNNYSTQTSQFALASSGTTVYVMYHTGSTNVNTYAVNAATGALIGSVNTLTSTETTCGTGCSLTIDNAGTLHAVWCSKNSTYPNSNNIRYSKSTDGGVTWATATQLTTMNTTGADCTHPCIVVKSSNNPSVSYQYYSGSDYTIHIDNWNGTAWSDVIIYDGSTYSQTNPCTVIDGVGNIHVVWHGLDSTDTTYNNIRYSKSTDGGSTWSAMTKLTSGNSYHQYSASISSDGQNNLHVIWYGYDPAVATSIANIRRIVNTGSTWGIINTLTSNTLNHAQGVQTFYASNTVSYIWQDVQNAQVRFNSYSTNSVALAGFDTSGNSGRKVVKLSNGWIVAVATSNNSPTFFVSKDNGNTWSQLCYINAPASAGIAIASSGTTVYILWGATNGTGNTFAKFDATTVTNSNQVGFTVDSGQSSFGSGVSLVIDGTGALHAAWCSKNSTYPNSNNVRYSKSTDGGNTWSTATQITIHNTSGVDTTNPCIVVRSNNNPTIVMQYVNGANYNQIYANTYSGSAWNSALSGKGVLVYDGTTYVQYNPCAAVDSNDNIHVVWNGMDSTYPSVNNVRYSKSTDGGNTWSAMTLLTTGNALGNGAPSIAIDGSNNLYVYWNGNDSFVTPDYVNIRTIKYSTGSWGTVSTITNNVFGDAEYPAVGWQKFNGWTDALRGIYNDTQGQVDSYITLTWNAAPNAPTHQNISSSGGTCNQYPIFFFDVSDPDSGNIIQNLELQVSTSSSFTSTVWDAQYGNDSGYGTNYGNAGGNLGGWTNMPTTTNTTTLVSLHITQASGWGALPTGTLYARARTKDNNGMWGAWSATQQFSVLAVPWSDTPSGYGLKAQWMNDLATVINNARQFRGLATFAFTDGTINTTIDMKAVHISERRTKLNDVLSIVGVTPSWTDPTVNNTIDRNSQHIIDLRTYCTQT